MDAIDLNAERRDEERQADLRDRADAAAGLVPCPNCGRRVPEDDRRACDATNAAGQDCRRQGCRHCIAADSAGNLYCSPGCGIDIYREMIEFEERSHKKLLAWYRERITALENER
jgi:hypothetical protein